MWLSQSSKNDLKGKRALLRIDADVDLKREGDSLVVDEDFRLRSLIPTINFLNERGVERIILIGHLGRPKGKEDPDLSLKPLARWFSENFASCSLIKLGQKVIQGKLSLLENLRFYPGEEENSQDFIDRLTELGEIFVNDAFASSHRDHASITGITKRMRSFLGLRFEAEVQTLSWVKKKPERPLVFVLGGSKKGKIDYLDFLANWADYLLVGGKLPLLLPRETDNYPSLVIGHLTENNRDIDGATIDRFEELISKGATIVWAGPMGVYEEKENRRGSWQIAEYIASREVFKIAGGGDTHRVLSWTSLWDKFDFVSVGGGAMLQFLRDETLPGIEAVEEK